MQTCWKTDATARNFSSKTSVAKRGDSNWYTQWSRAGLPTACGKNTLNLIWIEATQEGIIIERYIACYVHFIIFDNKQNTFRIFQAIFKGQLAHSNVWRHLKAHINWKHFTSCKGAYKAQTPNIIIKMSNRKKKRVNIWVYEDYRLFWIIYT